MPGHIAAAGQLLRAHWPKFLSIHLAAGLFTGAVLGPMLSMAIGWVVMASGDAALTDQAIARAFLSPLGFVLFLVAIALTLTVAVFEFAAMLAALWRLRRQEPVELWWLGRFLLGHFLKIFQLGLMMTVKVILLLAPFLAVCGWIALKWMTEYDINYYLDARPPEFLWAAAVILILLSLGGWFLLKMVSQWVPALPLLLLGQSKVTEVLPRSARLAEPMKGRIYRFLILWSVVFLLAYALAGFLLKLGGMAVVATAGDSLETLAWLMGALFLGWTALNVAIGLFAMVSLAMAAIELYEREAREADLEVTQFAPDVVPNPADRRIGGWALGISVLLLLSGLGVGGILLQEVRSESTPEVVAHRGASFVAPENTLAAVSQAIDDGAEWVEIDVQETAEGQIVVIHDKDLMRMGGAPLRVWDTPLAELQAVDIGSRHHPDYSDQRVPLLDELLKLTRDRIRVNIELKYYGQEQRFEERVAEVIEANDMADQVVLMSLDLAGARTMKALRPAWTVGLLSSVALGDLTRLDVDFFAVNAGFADRAFIDRAHQRDKQVLVWTVNDAAGISAAASKGVDGIITDRPDLARSVLARRADLDPIERFLIFLASELGSDFSDMP